MPSTKPLSLSKLQKQVDREALNLSLHQGYKNMSNQEQGQVIKEEKKFSGDRDNPMNARIIAFSKVKKINLTSIFETISYLYKKETIGGSSNSFPDNFVAFGGRGKWAIVELGSKLKIRIVHIGSGADGVVYAVHFLKPLDVPPMAVKVQDCGKRSYYAYEIHLMEVATHLAKNYKLSHFPVLYGAESIRRKGESYCMFAMELGLSDLNDAFEKKIIPVTFSMGLAILKQLLILVFLFQESFSLALGENVIHCDLHCSIF